MNLHKQTNACSHACNAHAHEYTHTHTHTNPCSPELGGCHEASLAHKYTHKQTKAQTHTHTSTHTQSTNTHKKTGAKTHRSTGVAMQHPFLTNTQADKSTHGHTHRHTRTHTPDKSHAKKNKTPERGVCHQNQPLLKSNLNKEKEKTHLSAGVALCINPCCSSLLVCSIHDLGSGRQLAELGIDNSRTSTSACSVHLPCFLSAIGSRKFSKVSAIVDY
jgi:hypothetical protein